MSEKDVQEKKVAKFPDEERFGDHFGHEKLKENWTTGTHKTEHLRVQGKVNKKSYHLSKTDKPKENEKQEAHYCYSEDFIPNIEAIKKVTHTGLANYYDVYDLENSIIVSREHSTKTLDETTKQKFTPWKDMKVLLKLQHSIKSLLYLKKQHKLGHGRLSPKYIMLDDRDQFKLSDYGLNCKIDVSDKKNVLSKIQQDSSRETTIYISPQLLHFIKELKTDIDIDWEKEDMFSLGVVIFQLVTGFGVTYCQAINADRVQSEDLIKKALVEKQLWSPIIKKMCAWDENDRYTLLELREALDKFKFA